MLSSNFEGWFLAESGKGHKFFIFVDFESK